MVSLKKDFVPTLFIQIKPKELISLVQRSVVIPEELQTLPEGWQPQSCLAGIRNLKRKHFKVCSACLSCQ